MRDITLSSQNRRSGATDLVGERQHWAYSKSPCRSATGEPRGNGRGVAIGLPVTERQGLWNLAGRRSESRVVVSRLSSTAGGTGPTPTPRTLTSSATPHLSQVGLLLGVRKDTSTQLHDHSMNLIQIF